ncbi:MAG: hypothetical protein KGL39_49475, partial [Patescibacteria group bacterium]|nr:hypothetical protein [Patescibacteria group bacterium]
LWCGGRGFHTRGGAMDTMQMGAAGVAIEREINAKLRAENAELLAACEAVERLVATEYREGNGMAVMEQVRAAIASARAAGKGE